MNEYKVSIVVPVYNVEKYLEQCLESLVKQTYHNIEIVIVNDGATDNSQQIINRYCQNYPEICFGYMKTNGGLSSARNYGIQRSTGEFITFVDSDDYITENGIELLINKVYETGAEVVVCDSLRFFPSGKNEIDLQMQDEHLHGKSIKEKPEIIVQCSASVCNKLFKRNWFDEIKFPEGRIYEDIAVTYNLMACANKIEYVNSAIYYYRQQREGSITDSELSEEAFDIFFSCNEFVEYYRKHNLLEACFAEVEYSCIARFYCRVFESERSSEHALRWKYIKTMFQTLNQQFPNWRKNKYFLEKKIRIDSHILELIFNVIRDKYILLQFTMIGYYLLYKLSIFFKEK